MTIEEAKQLRIVDYLASLGHRPQRIRSDQYWYLSPLRVEHSPSFKVNDQLNEWYDFGEAAGGDLVELGKYLYRTNDVSEVLAYIGQHARVFTIAKIRSSEMPVRPVESEMQEIRIVPLRHFALLSYLRSRSIDGDLGRMFCREIHYRLRRRHYFALAFGNVSGGYEVRNPYYKGCIMKKDISLVRHSHEGRRDEVCVFEGFIDFLSYLTLKQSGNVEVCVAVPCDYLVMNSVHNLKRTLKCLQDYKTVHCYLDNDLAGQKTTETIAGMFGVRVHDESCRYRAHKDLNDYLRGKVL